MKKFFLMSVVFLLLCMTANVFAQAPEAKCAGIVDVDDPSQLIVVFDQEVDPASATTKSNYFLSGITMLDAQLSDELSNCVYLTLSKPLNVGSTYSLYYRNIANPLGEKLTYFKSPNTFEVTSLARDAQEIMKRQLPDGIYNMGAPMNGVEFAPGDPIWISPSFALHGALALSLAYEMDPDPAYLDSALRCLQWYANHLRPDGTVNDWGGYYPDYTESETCDSTDAYAAQFIHTAYVYYRATEDEAFLDWVWPYIIKVAGAIDLTLQPDGLTWAKPDFYAKFAMDNSEVWQGYKAAAYFAALKNDTARLNEWQTKADNSLAGLETLYLGDEYSRYAFQKLAGDYLDTSWGRVYPDAMAQMTVIRYVLFENNMPRARAVWQTTADAFIPNGVPVDGLEGWCVLGTVAAGYLDSAYRDITYACYQKSRLADCATKGYLYHYAINVLILYQEWEQTRYSRANFNDDHYVDIADFSSLCGYWLDDCAENPSCQDVDINKDGNIDSEDLMLFVDSWLAKRGWWD